MARATVLYDGDCGFCRWSADKLRTWDRHGRLAFATIQGSIGQELLGSLDPDRRLDSWHVVEPNGRLWSAGAAAPLILRLLPFGGPLAALAELAPGLTDRTYRLVARNRGRIGRLLGQTACSVDPSRERA
jgi:predicted DCC family thiol-disulfide oxidoreductase YuxK